MKNIKEILKEFGIEMTDEQIKSVEKAVAENYKTIAEVEKKTSKTDTEIASLRQQLETANETLKGFDGIDPTQINNSLNEYKTKMAELEESHKKELYKRDFSDILTKELESHKFSSTLAKDRVSQIIQDAELKIVDGKIIGLNDMMENIKTKYTDAFVSEQQEQQQQNKATFTGSIGSSQNTGYANDPENMSTEQYFAWRKEQK